MRTGTLAALCGAALFGFVGVAQASPLAASGGTNSAIQLASNEGVVQVKHRHGHWKKHRHYRHYGWHRGHHHGWRHGHHHRHHHAYGYHRSGVVIRF